MQQAEDEVVDILDIVGGKKEAAPSWKRSLEPEITGWLNNTLNIVSKIF